MKDDAPKETNSIRSLGNALAWILIAVLTILTVVWMVWAAHQPEVRSIWAPE